jgi:hypothetical protein
VANKLTRAMRRLSDADALTAVLAWERCQEMADRSQDDSVREGWRREAEAAWGIVERWLAQDRPAGRRALADHGGQHE